MLPLLRTHFCAPVPLQLYLYKCAHVRGDGIIDIEHLNRGSIRIRGSFNVQTFVKVFFGMEGTAGGGERSSMTESDHRVNNQLIIMK